MLETVFDILLFLATLPLALAVVTVILVIGVGLVEFTVNSVDTGEEDE